MSYTISATFGCFSSPNVWLTKFDGRIDGFRGFWAKQRKTVTTKNAFFGFFYSWAVALKDDEHRTDLLPTIDAHWGRQQFCGQGIIKTHTATVKCGEVWGLQDESYVSKPRPVVVIQSDEFTQCQSVVLCLLTSFNSTNLPTRPTNWSFNREWTLENQLGDDG